MTRKIILFVLLLVTSLSYESNAQETRDFKAKSNNNQWELGLHLGHTAITGDVDWNSSFGVGLHARKALDHIFSVRLDVGYQSFKGEEEENRREVDAANYADAANPGAFGSDWLPVYESSMIGGDLQMVMSLNQFKLKKKKKINPYIFVGGGVGSISVTAIDEGREFDVVDRGFDDEWDISAYMTGGAGLGFRLSDKISLSIEHKLERVLGRGGDLMDAVEWRGTLSDKVITPQEDLLHYTNIRLGIDLGKKDAEDPLWWANNPMDEMAEDLAEVKARPILDLTDDDEDGVINMLDQEPDSEKGCAVDTRGIVLDSDGDGVVDCKDDEPYSPVGYEIDAKGVAQVPPPATPLNEGDVNKIVDAKLAKFNPGTTESRADWFLPMIHYNLDKYSIKNSEYGKLHQIAQVMKSHPDLSVVATGYTDRLSGDCYNKVLSYNRANAAIDYMVGKYGIDRSRFILNYGGRDNNLVQTNSGNLMNRRVEFTVASGESQMGRPDCGVGNAGTGGSGGSNYSGNKEAGY